jgi:MFS family permease
MCMTTLTDHAGTTRSPEGDTRPERAGSVRRRLRPLYAAGWFAGVNFWVPIEKLFLSRIGFNAGSIGLLAATYAAVVPFLEIPTGILADRWSRRGVLMVAYVALGASAVVGGLSTNVSTYLVAALLLGVYFAMQSGTVESIIYDLVIEETGVSDDFERELARLRMWEGVALVSSALVGGAIATVTPLRLTYFFTVPFVVLSILALAKFAEPRLHQSDEPEPLRRQVTTTYKTIVEPGRLRSIVFTMVLCALVLQTLLEFGPLWMLALAAPAFLYGPQWAGLMTAVGLGGILAARTNPNRTSTLATAAAVMLGCAVTLATSDNSVVIIAAQVVLALLVVAVSTVATRMFHDEIPSSIRAGVSSGVGTLTWIAFLPFALVFGFVTKHSGIHGAAWMIVAATITLSVAMVRIALPRARTHTSDTRSAGARGVPAELAA